MPRIFVVCVVILFIGLPRVSEATGSGDGADNSNCHAFFEYVNQAPLEVLPAFAASTVNDLADIPEVTNFILKQAISRTKRSFGAKVQTPHDTMPLEARMLSQQRAMLDAMDKDDLAGFFAALIESSALFDLLLGMGLADRKSAMHRRSVEELKDRYKEFKEIRVRINLKLASLKRSEMVYRPFLVSTLDGIGKFIFFLQKKVILVTEAKIGEHANPLVDEYARGFIFDSKINRTADLFYKALGRFDQNEALNIFESLLHVMTRVELVGYYGPKFTEILEELHGMMNLLIVFFMDESAKHLFLDNILDFHLSIRGMRGQIESRSTQMVCNKILSEIEAYQAIIDFKGGVPSPIEWPALDEVEFLSAYPDRFTHRVNELQGRPGLSGDRLNDYRLTLKRFADKPRYLDKVLWQK